MTLANSTFVDMLTAKKRDWIEILIHAVFWVGVYFSLDSFADSHSRFLIERNGMVMDGMEVHRVASYPFVTLGFLGLLFYGNIFWLFKKMLRLRNIAARVALTAGWFMLIFVANYFATKLLLLRQRRITVPVVRWSAKPVTDSLAYTKPPIPHELSWASQHLGGKTPPPLPDFTTDLAAWPHSQFTMLLISLAVLGVSLAYFFLKEWGRAEIVRNQVQARQLDTEIKFLKSQINPHFLFNTLNNLFSMAQAKGNDELADGISTLSGMMRYMIYESNEGRVPLQKEIEYLHHYILLNKLRYADGEVNILFNYPRKTDGCFVAPMLFIPFVENAFKHGVAIGQSSQIDVTILLQQKQLLFNCKNPCYGFIRKMEEEKDGIDLENVKRRLELVYPSKHTLMVDDRDGQYNVNLQIDLA